MQVGIEFKKQDGKKLKIGIVKSRWNSFITDPLLDRCKKALLDSGVEEKNIIIYDYKNTSCPINKYYITL